MDKTIREQDLVRMQNLFDRQDIQDCLARIARGTDRFDRDLFLSGFHPGASISAFGNEASAEDTFESGRAMHEESTFATLHCLSTMSFDIDGDTAHVETYHIYTARNRDETHWVAAGRYLDQFERRDDRWGVVFRHIAVEWTGQLAPGPIALGGLEEQISRLGSSRGNDDVSYLRPLAP